MSHYPDRLVASAAALITVAIFVAFTGTADPAITRRS
ncbi:hypothetical protein SAMN04489732_13326 [Amycolatopsis saalfeldensis]|uniref:Uncharacterized protein n=1 Tax=Amycolatopsis saalfeldensis TaxID=394193 RepID=A0A1H8YPJ7_9PSEU|nr:hypothetical protein SAMN04489732_13326 [Amycolatopsis saalfeldensis]